MNVLSLYYHQEKRVMTVRPLKIVRMVLYVSTISVKSQKAKKVIHATTIKTVMLDSSA